MRIVIHCGAYKTGSSSIQNYFYENRSLFKKEYKIFYPTAGIYRSAEIGFRHTKLFYSFGKEAWSNYILKMRSQLLDARDSGCSVALISSEALSNPATHPALIEFIRLLGEWGFNDVEGLLYVRNWYDYVVRHYREFTLRHKNVKPISSYILKNGKIFDYPTVFCALSAIFSKKISLVVYEHVDSVLDDCCSRLKMLDLKEKEKGVNRGWRAVDIEFARCCNLKEVLPKDIVYSEMAKDELGISFSSSSSSEFPSLLTSATWLSDLNWLTFKESFSLSDDQISLLLAKPVTEKNKCVYELNEIISLIVDKLAVK